jgi:hypothetical protein
MDWVGCLKGSVIKKYVCENHISEWIKRSRKFTWNGNEYTQEYLMLVPKSEGPKSFKIDASSVSKELGRDPALHQLLNDNVSQNVRNHSESLSNEVCDAIILDLRSQKPKTMTDKLRISKEINNIMAAKIETLELDLAQSNAALQQMAEENTDKNNVPINPNVLHAMGIQVSRRNADEMRVPGKPFFHLKVMNQSKTRRQCSPIANNDPVVDSIISNKEVQCCTGFSSVSALLAYIFVVGNVEIDRIVHPALSLMWFEEWFLF